MIEASTETPLDSALGAQTCCQNFLN